jgi:hypothetical protein
MHVCRVTGGKPGYDVAGIGWIPTLMVAGTEALVADHMLKRLGHCGRQLALSFVEKP